MNSENTPESSQASSRVNGRDLDSLLLIAANHTGNNVFITPSIRLLKRHFPDLTIDVVSLDAISGQVFAGNPDIGRLVVTDSARKVGRLSRDYPFVLCLNRKSDFLLKHVKVPRASIPGFDGSGHHADQTLKFVADVFGLPVTDEDREYHLTPGGELADDLKAALERGSKPIVGIHLGCSRTSTHGWKFFYKKRGEHKKLWPIDNYIKLAGLIREAYPESEIVITGTRNEAFLAKDFERQVPGTINLIGKTSIQSLFKSIQAMHLFITHDCGVLHVASATTTPLVSLFGPTSPAQTGPWPDAEHRRKLKQAEIAEITPEDTARQALSLLD